MCNDNNKIKTTVTIKVSEFYGSSCSGDEYIEVTQEVYDYLVFCKKEERRVEMQNYRHVIPCDYDEVKMGELCGKVSKSSDDEYFDNTEEKRFNEAFNSLSETYKLRLFKHFFLGYTKKAIAAQENVSEFAVRKSIRAGLEKFYKKYSEID